jgi:3-methyladenine DNA glycosylase/8-oxoguanine DNA glycosylase
MVELNIPCPAPFHFHDVVFSHGWLRLPPYYWEPEAETLSRVERLPSGRLAWLALNGKNGALRLRTDASAEDAAVLAARVRWLLALDDDLAGFHTLCHDDPGLHQAGGRGQGRILRSSTVWEDLVKTLFSVNTTWRQTIAMTENLVALCGEEGADGRRSFPEPGAVAACEAAELQIKCRVGYRAGPLSLLARAIAEDRLDLEALKDAALTDEEVEARLRSLHGIGPYATANVMLLLGRYDYLPVDSWFRKTVRDGWFDGRTVPDRDLIAPFDRYRPYRALAYYFYDWKGAMRTEVWQAEVG